MCSCGNASCMCFCVCVQEREGHGSQKSVLGVQELELQGIVSCLVWVLGTKLGFSGRAVSVLNCSGSSLAPKTFF